MTKRVFIKTYGCQMNVYDSRRMTELVAPLGYAPSDEARDADLVILNTCHIREKAAEKVFSELGSIRHLKTAKERRGERMIVAVAGCVAQAEGAEILRRAPFVDMVFGPQTYHRLPEMIARATRAGGGILETDFPAEAKFDHLPETASAPAVSALLSIQEGCDKFCTFCVVPYTRGAEFSRPAAQVIAEAERLVAAGAREITLLGQNVNAYHGAALDGSEWGLADLLRALARSREPRPAALHDIAPARCRRRPHRRAWRPARADADAAPAGAKRLRPRARGDEPATHRRRLPPHGPELAAG